MPFGSPHRLPSSPGPLAVVHPENDPGLGRVGRVHHESPLLSHQEGNAAPAHVLAGFAVDLVFLHSRQGEKHVPRDRAPGRADLQRATHDDRDAGAIGGHRLDSDPRVLEHHDGSPGLDPEGGPGRERGEMAPLRHDHAALAAD